MSQFAPSGGAYEALFSVYFMLRLFSQNVHLHPERNIYLRDVDVHFFDLANFMNTYIHISTVVRFFTGFSPGCQIGEREGRQPRCRSRTETRGIDAAYDAANPHLDSGGQVTPKKIAIKYFSVEPAVLLFRNQCTSSK